MRVLALEPSFQRKRAQEKALAAEWAEAWDAFMVAFQGTTLDIQDMVFAEWNQSSLPPVPTPLFYKPSSEDNRQIRDFVERVHFLEAIEQAWKLEKHQADMNTPRRDQRIAEMERAIGVNTPHTAPPVPPNLNESLRPEAVALRRRLEKAAAAPAKNWNEQKAIDAIKRQFALLDVPLPEIVVADSPFEARQIAEAKQALWGSPTYQGPLLAEMGAIAQQSAPTWANVGTGYSDLPPTFIIDGELATWTNGRVVTNTPALALEVRHRTLFGTAFGTKKVALFEQCRANVMVWIWKETWQTAYKAAKDVVRKTLRSVFWTDIHALLWHDIAPNALPPFRHILFELDHDAPIRLAMIQTGIPVEENPTSGNAQTFKQFDAFLEAEIEAFEAGLGFYLEVGNLFILTPAPAVLRDEQGRLHSDEKPAIHWRDGSGFFYLHDVAFDKNLFWRVVSREMTFSQIMRMGNMEQRQQALYYADAESLLAENGAELLDTFVKKRPDGTDIHYALYQIPPHDMRQVDALLDGIDNLNTSRVNPRASGLVDPFPNGAWYVLYDDATPTGRKYLSGVPNGSKTVPEAMAAKFRFGKRRMTPEEWKRLSPMTTET